VAERALIRQNLVALLLGQTAAGQRVSSSRARAVWRQGLPAILVYSLREEWAEHAQSPRIYRVATTVALELFVEETATGPADDQLDALGAEVLAVLFRYPSLGLDDCELRPATYDADFGSGKKRIGAGRITCEVVHYVEAPEGDPALVGDFLTAHFEHRLQPDDGQVDAVDDVTLAQ